MGAHEVLPNLFQGSRPPTGDSLRRNGVSALVLAAEEFQPRSKQFPGVTVAHVPLDDHLQPLTADEWGAIVDAASFVDANVRDGRKTLVTCKMGINRSGIITATAVVFLTRCTGKEAVRLVKKKRPNALLNSSFARQVEEMFSR